MGARTRIIRATIATVVAVALIPSPTHAQTDSTVEVLTRALESLRAGDDAGYQAAADQLTADGHWLPSAGWTALELRDDEGLSFVWLLLDAPGDEPLLWAFDQVVLERDLLAGATTGGAADLAFLSVVDTDGVTILEVLDHRGIHFSPDARRLLQPLPDDLAQAPDSSAYDDVIGSMATRLQGNGYLLPAIPGLDEIIESVPASPPMPPRPGGDPFGAPTDSATPVPPTADMSILDADVTEEPPTIDDALTTDATVVSDDSGDAADIGDTGVEAVETTGDEPPTDANPSMTPATETAPRDSPSIDTTAPRTDVDPLTIGLGAMGALGLALALISMRRNRHNDQLADIAYTDSLTGLSNRRRLDLDLSNEVRHGGRQTSILMIDVDHFKQFNDVHGHATGDDALRRVGAIIARNVRKHDLAYRYGGEEFSVLLPNTSPDEALDVGERVRHAIERTQIDLADGTTISVTASLGLSSGPAEQVSHLVQRADQALYIAKDNGRNQLASG